MNDLRSSMDASALPPARAGFWRGTSRWMVEHPKAVLLVSFALWLASCAVVWRYAMQAGMIEDEPTAERQLLSQLRKWPGWVLMPAAILWLWRWGRAMLGDNKHAATVSRPARSGLGAMRERRLVERKPIPYEVLPGLLRLGAVGIGIAVLLSFWMAVIVGSGRDGRAAHFSLIPATMLCTLVVYFATVMLREVFFLWNDDYFIAGKEDEVIAKLEEDQRKEAETEREYDRKSLGGWQVALLYGSWLGGGMLMLKFLSDQDGVVAFQTGASAMIASSVWIYTTRLRPKGWRLGLGLTLLGSVAFLIFTVHTWGLRWLPLGLGLLFGAGVGIPSTLAYVRKLGR